MSSLALSLSKADELRAVSMTLPFDRTTPLGFPVVPEVYSITQVLS